MMVGLKRISTAFGLVVALASVGFCPGRCGESEPIDCQRRGRHAAIEPEPGGIPDRDRGPRRAS